ncbi:MAG: hypothetical protein V7750_03785 [Sneathiella sp.]
MLILLSLGLWKFTEKIEAKFVGVYMKTARFEFKIDKAANCIFVRHFGLVDLASILDRGSAIFNHADYQSGLNRITDFTGVETKLSSEDIRLITDKISLRKTESGNYREAVIVDNLLGYGLVRIFNSLSSLNENEYEIFSTEDGDVSFKVKNWLNLDSSFLFPGFLSVK